MGTPDLQLTIRYRDQTHTLAFAAATTGRTIGRADLQRWFRLPADALIHISKAHFTVTFSDGRYWIDEHSSFGTLVRAHDGPILPPYRKRRRARVALGRRTELLLSNTNRADNSADHVYVFVDNPAASDTLAVFVDPLWDQLLRRLESGRLITGFIAHRIGKIDSITDTKKIFKWSLIAAIGGLLFNVIFDPLVGYFYKLLILGKPAAELTLAWNVAATSINAVTSTIAAVAIYMALRPALQRSGMFDKLRTKE